MEIEQIKKLALALTHTKDSQVPDDNLLHTFFNLARKNVAREIMQEVGENFYYDVDYIDSEKDRADGKYSLPADSAGRPRFAKYNGVFIRRHNAQDKYIRAMEVDPNAPGFNWENYLDGTNEVFFISCNSIFIAPQFTSSLNQAIKITGILEVHDLNPDDDESLMAVPTSEHEIIAWAMAPYIYKYRGKDEAALNAEAELQNKMREMVQRLTDRVDNDMIRRLPDAF